MANSKKMFNSTLFIAFVLACFMASGGLAAVPEYVPGEVIVKFKPGIEKALKAEIFTKIKGLQIRETRIQETSVLTFSNVSVEDVVAQYKDHPMVEYAEPNYIYEFFVSPNDPGLNQQWFLKNTGQEIIGWGAGTPGADIRATHAWNITNGDHEVLIAIIDSGVQIDHPDLVGNIYTNPGEVPGNGIDDDGNGYVDDVHGWNVKSDGGGVDDTHGHGTAVASVAAGMTNNALGVAGTAWSVSILPISTGGFFSNVEDLADAIDYALQMNTDIVNMSLGGSAFSQTFYEACARADSAGMLLVCAAGNESDELTELRHEYPASYDFDVNVNVASSNFHDELAEHSNYGTLVVDLAAPGEHIYSALIDSDYGLIDGYGNGTSFAAPIVAGALGLLYSQNGVPAPSERRQFALDMKQRLLDNVDVLPQFLDTVGSGGRLNTFLALAEADDIAPATLTDARGSMVASSWFEAQWTAVGDDGNVGTAAAYDLRISDQPIYNFNWDDATRVVLNQKPVPAGQIETVHIGGLNPDTVYYWSIKVQDEWGAYLQDMGLDSSGNTSGMGHTGSIKTMVAPTITIEPEGMDVAAVKQQANRYAFTIGNPNPAILDFQVETEPGFSQISIYQRDSYILPFGESEELFFVNADNLPCGVTETYLLINSNDPLNPTLTLPVKITVSGVGDVNVEVTNLDFEEVVFGTPKSMFVEVQNVGCDNLIIHAIYTDNSDFRIARKVRNIPGESSVQIEVVFEPKSYGEVFGNLIVHAIDPDEPSLEIPLVGVGVTPPDIDVSDEILVTPNLFTGADHTFNVLVANQGGFPLTFTANNGGDGWLTVPGEIRLVPVGGSVIVPVSVSAEGLCASRQGVVILASDDPDEPTVEVAVNLEVIAAQNIAFNSLQLDWGTFSDVIGRLPAMVLTVTNSGCSDLVVASATSDLPEVFSVLDGSGFVLLQGQSTTISVKLLNPWENGRFAGNLEIISDDPDNLTQNIEMKVVFESSLPGSPDLVLSEIVEPYTLDLKNYPNPFNPSTEFSFNLERSGQVEVWIYDLRGALIRIIDGGVQTPGMVTLQWQGKTKSGMQAASGFYLYMLIQDGEQLGHTGKLSLIK